MNVVDKLISIQTPAEIQCIKGYKSLPVEIQMDYAPFEPLQVTFELDESSSGVNLGSTKPLGLSLAKSSGLL